MFRDALAAAPVPRAPASAAWHESLAPLELARLLRDPVLRGSGVPRGDGEPVLLVPGFLVPDSLMQIMGGWLRRTGHRPLHAGLGTNAGCAAAAMTRLEALLESVVARKGRRAAIVGHSRGGAYARALAVRRPDLVSGIVTLGTPMMTCVEHGHPGMRILIRAVGTLGGLGIPGLLRGECLHGACCAGFREDSCAPFPAEVSFLRVVGDRDHVVGPRWRADPDAETTAVDGSHVGVIVNPEGYRAVADGLRRARDADARRQSSGPLRRSRAA